MASLIGGTSSGLAQAVLFTVNVFMVLVTD